MSMSGRNAEEKGLLWKLPPLKSNQLGKLGPAFGIGAGCGVGFAFGLLGGEYLSESNYIHSRLTDS